MNSNRLVYIDVAKCFAIFLVVWGHVIQNYGESSLINKTIYEYFILTFHMPLFAIISGMFYKNTITWRKVIVEKGRHLILPLVCWCLLLFSIIPNVDFLVQGKYEDLHLFASIRNWYYGITDWGFWFLRALFFCFLYSQLFSRIHFSTTVVVDILSVVLLYSLSFLGVIPNKCHLLNGFVFLYPFFVVGKYIKELLNHHKGKPITLGTLVLYCCCLFFWNGDADTFYGNNTSLFADNEGIVGISLLRQTFLRFVLGVSGSIIVLYLIKYACEKFMQNKSLYILSNVGQKTLIIYIIHAVVLMYLPKADLPCPEVMCFVLSVILLVLSMAIGALLSKNKYLGMFFLGTIKK